MTAPRYDLVIFDVDGTLHDSFESIARSYQHMLREGFGRDQQDLEVFRPCIGPPITECFALLGITGDDVPLAMALYQDYFNREAQRLVELYPGAEEMLAAFCGAGIGMAVASSKHTHVIETLFQRDGIAGYFGYISGVQGPHEHISKKQLIQRALTAMSVERGRAVMVGDRFYDAEGARGAGVDFIAAAYGMAEAGEFDSYPAVLQATSIRQVHDFILQKFP